MNTRERILGVTLVALLFLPWAEAVAAPMPPLLVVNHDSKQCAEIFGGDECMDCFPPAGWEIVGVSSQVECPQGYTRVETLDYTCQGFKNQRCCSEGHTGAHGSCEDLVVNDRAKQCAFVESVDNCALPKNWSSKPGDQQPTDWFCPAEYQWLENSLECAAGEGESVETGSGRSFCPLAAGIGPFIIIIWLLIKRTR
jgi:hypothetical protein